jgi:hypothetical protein
MMNNDPLDHPLGDYARRPLPRCPGDMSAAVWREIEKRRRRPFWSRVLPLLDWRELLAEPRIAAAALACAFAIGILPASIAARSYVEQRLAQQSLYFDVFSESSSKSFPAALTASPAPAPDEHP